MSYTTKRCAVRTVKNGRVKIGGQYFAPHDHHLSYDDRLEGKRLLFGRYDLYSFQVYLVWASLEYPAPEVIIDGKIHWQNWRAVT